MTTSPRVAMVARRFWPHAGSDTSALATRLAVDLAQSGYSVRVVAPHHRREKPGHFTYRGVDVRRPMSPPRSEWVSGRYARQWAHWLQQHAGDADVIVAVGAREEAVAAISAAKKMQVPLLLAPITEGPENDSVAWGQGAAARRYLQTFGKADRIVVGDPSSVRMLVSQGIASERIVAIAPGIRSISGDAPQGVPAGEERRSTSKRGTARRVLGAVNLDLAADVDVPVVLCDSGMVRGGPIECLVESAMPLVRSFPTLRLWMVGDGPSRSRLYDRLRGDGVRQSIAMPGSFCDAEDLMSAADVFVHLLPSPEFGGITRALAQRRVIACVDTQANRQWFARASNTDGIGWFDLNPESLLKTLRELIRDLPSASAAAQEYGRSMTRQYPMDRCVRAWEAQVAELATRLAAARTSGDPPPIHEGNQA